MASELETVQDDASRAPPAGVKVTPIPPPTIPYSPTGSSASGSATTTPTAATAQPPPPPSHPPSLAPTSAPATTPPTPTAAATAPVVSSPTSGAAAAPPVAAGLASPLPSSLPQKRALADEDHTPAVRSPLNPEFRATPKLPTAPPPPDEASGVMGREKRTKKESLKKRESKAALAAEAAAAAAARATPEPKRKEKDGATTTNGGSTPTHADSGSGSGSSNGNHTNGVKKPGDPLPVRVRLAGSLRPSDFEQPAGPIFRTHHNIQVPDGQVVELFELYSEHASRPINRRGYVYESGIADPRFPSLHYFRQTEAKPHHAHISFEDAPPNVFFDQSGLHVSGEAGFRTARANVAVRQGRWFWECKVTRGIVRQDSVTATTTTTTTATEEGVSSGEPASHGHVRVGWARREASRDAPVGYDAYGYGIRDRKGQRVHMSRPRECLLDGADLCEGDVLGLEIQLPSEALHRKIVQGTYNPAADLLGDDVGPNVVRDRIPFRFQTSKLVFEKFDYHPIKELEDLANPAPTVSSSAASAAAAGGGGGGGGGGSSGSGGGGGGGGANEPPNPTHPVPCLRTLPGSWIRVYKNGVLQGTPFTNLLAFLPPASTTNAKMQEGARERLDDGTLGYYPAVSLFRGGAVETNFGPHFWYPPPDYEVPQHGEGAAMATADSADSAAVAANAANAASLDGGGGGGGGGGGVGAAGIDDDVMMVEVGDEDTADVRPLSATTTADAAAADAAARQLLATAGEAAGDDEDGPPRLSGASLAPLPLTKMRPMGERYEEQIAEDIVYDIVDEVYFWMLDGGKTQSAAAAAAAGGGGGGGGGEAGEGRTAVASAAAAAAEGSKDVTMEDI